MIRQEQCDKVCRILDDVLANRPTERDSLIVAVRKAFDALKKQRWIPCSERLPEDSDYHDFWETPDGAVMWCKRTGEIGVGWYYASTKTWCDLWDNGAVDVIAWMPLPTPYREGKKS